MRRPSPLFIFCGLCAALLTACNSQSEIDTGFLGNPTSNGGVTPFDQTFTFNAGNTSSYTFNSSSIQFTGGLAELTPATFIDQNDGASGFGGGSATGTTWDGTNSYVRLSQTGTPTNNSELDSSWAPEWSSLISYWPMENNWNDSIGGNNGSTSTATFTTSAKIGSYAGSFSGSSIVTVPGFTSQQLQAFTISVWVNSSSSMSNYNTIAALEASDETNRNFWLGLSQGTQGVIGGPLLLAETNGVANNLDLYGSHAINDGNWHMIVATVKSGTAIMYVDGAQAGSTTYATPINTASNSLAIGDTLNSFYPLSASIDDLAIWSTALTAAEVRTLYNRQSAKYAGTFDSRVMDGLASSAGWTSLAWTPTLPFFKELPDYASGSVQNETTANYSSLEGDTPAAGDNDLMTGIVGLWHLDEAAGTSGSGSVLDRSGQGNNGTPTNVTFGVNGRLGTAASFDGSNSNISASITGFPTGAAPRTISVWFQPNGLTSNLQCLFSYGLGLTNAAFGLFAQYGTAFFSSWGPSVVGGLPLTLGAWNNIVLTYGGGSGSTFAMYVNGVLDTTASSGFSSISAVATASGDAWIGGWVGSGLPAYGQIDEVAVWNKALNATEVLQLYRRGANRIKYQVRSCPDSTCSTNPAWLGPDGTNQTYFSELNNNSSQGAGGDLISSDAVLAGLPTMTFSNFSPSLSISNNRYFQYRAVMESDDTGTGCNYGSGATWCSPELQSVSAAPTHYDNSAPTLANNSGLSYKTLTGFTESLGTDGCSSHTVYNLSADGSNWYYWTGAAWGLANGTSAQANQASVIGTNISTFASQVGAGSLYFRVFMQSSGTTPCELGGVEVTGTH